MMMYFLFPKFIFVVSISLSFTLPSASEPLSIELAFPEEMVASAGSPKYFMELAPLAFATIFLFTLILDEDAPDALISVTIDDIFAAFRLAAPLTSAT